MNSREVAFKTIYGVVYQDKYSNILLENHLNEAGLSDKDRNLVNVIVMGTLSHYLYLEHLIKSMSTLAYSKISKSVRTILAMSLYQMIFLDKIPDFAIVDEGVSLCQKYAGRQAKNFVNALLRKAVTIKDTPDAYLKDLNKKEYLSIKHSFHMNVVNQLYKKYGFDQLNQMFSSLNDFGRTNMLVNTLKTTKKDLKKALTIEGFVVDDHSEKNRFFISGNQNPSHSDLYKNGYYSLMDKGAMEMVEAFQINEEEDILDACAAPGGKTIYMACQMKNTGTITACDIHESRVTALKNNMKRMGITNVKSKAMDMTKYHDEYKGKFDKVLLDVPCSGLGVSVKRPEIKLGYEYRQELIDTQRLILENGGKYVKRGGLLLYGTCTILPCENEMNVEWFLKNHPYKMVDMKNIVASNENMGFYYCLMEKIDD